MKPTIRAFGLGVALTAMTLGAVTYANALSNSTIRACADRKTGDMRLITKGKCKKTERSLSWNQIGPQGAQGVPGVKGDAGAEGSAAKQWIVTDATGKNLGKFVSYLSSENEVGSSTSSNVVFQHDGLLFAARTNRFSYLGTGGYVGMWFSSNLPSRLPYGSTGPTVTGQDTWVYRDKVYKANGTPREFTGSVVYDDRGSLLSASDAATFDRLFSRWIELTEISAPTYQAPLKIVEQ